MNFAATATATATQGSRNCQRQLHNAKLAASAAHKLERREPVAARALRPTANKGAGAGATRARA